MYLKGLEMDSDKICSKCVWITNVHCRRILLQTRQQLSCYGTFQRNVLTTLVYKEHRRDLKTYLANLGINFTDETFLDVRVQCQIEHKPGQGGSCGVVAGNHKHYRVDKHLFVSQPCQ